MRRHPSLTSNWSRWMWTAAVATLAAIVIAGCGSNPPYRLDISGDIQRSLNGGAIYYEGGTRGRQIYIEQIGPGDDIRVLVVGLPAETVPGSYPVSGTGAVTASYMEFVDGVSRRYDRAVTGTIDVLEGGDRFSGFIDFTAFDPLRDVSIRVQGSFNELAYESVGSSGTIASAGLICLLTGLLGANFLAQFYIGVKVYADRPLPLLAMLNGTRTFIRGWRFPALRSVMIIWTAVLVILLLLIGALGVLAFLQRG